MTTDSSHLSVAPILLFNLAPLAERVSSSIPLTVLPLRLDSDLQLPTAAMVTVSRIASPLSVDRQYQPLFLNALKLHFEQVRRAVCNGDIIAVPINAALAKLLPSTVKDDVEPEAECVSPSN